MQAQDHWTASGRVPPGVQGRCPHPHTIPLGFCPRGPGSSGRGRGLSPPNVWKILARNLTALPARSPTLPATGLLSLSSAPSLT